MPVLRKHFAFGGVKVHPVHGDFGGQVVYSRLDNLRVVSQQGDVVSLIEVSNSGTRQKLHAAVHNTVEGPVE